MKWQTQFYERPKSLESKQSPVSTDHVKPGDFIAKPAGRGIAHQFINMADLG
ncbi:MAG TPA: hypothetical protein VH309_04960 [Elusimicrobiota bacterium]|jgi:hypothetical protein|nr:hypothetical protein [Elusimicrobiota bacterium]